MLPADTHAHGSLLSEHDQGVMENPRWKRQSRGPARSGSRSLLPRGLASSPASEFCPGVRNSPHRITVARCTPQGPSPSSSEAVSVKRDVPTGSFTLQSFVRLHARLVCALYRQASPAGGCPPTQVQPLQVPPIEPKPIMQPSLRVLREAWGGSKPPFAQDAFTPLPHRTRGRSRSPRPRSRRYCAGACPPSKGSPCGASSSAACRRRRGSPSAAPCPTRAWWSPPPPGDGRTGESTSAPGPGRPARSAPRTPSRGTPCHPGSSCRRPGSCPPCTCRGRAPRCLRRPSPRPGRAS
mmetsp:Transcript_9008/g.26700  ORF Transcript_9008/g.26700 Transcript_9008/m.26700 type:complete len:295 (-) Transcript_9008:65-949(-)